MSDTSAIDAAAAVAAEPAATPAPAEGGGVEGSAPSPSAGATPEPVSMLDTELPEGMRQFDRSYVERLRDEAAGNRVAAREAREQLTQLQQRYSAFDSYDEADMNVWGGLADQWRSNPAEAAATMRNIANGVLGDPTATTAEKVEAIEQLEAVDAAEAGDQRPVEEIVRTELDKRDQQHRQESEVQKIVNQVESAGYPQGTPEYHQVLWYAANDRDVNGDVGKALAKYEAQKQAIIDDYVKNVAAGQTPPVTTGGVPEGQAAVPNPGVAKTMKEASQRARAWLESQ